MWRTAAAEAGALLRVLFLRLRRLSTDANRTVVLFRVRLTQPIDGASLNRSRARKEPGRPALNQCFGECISRIDEANRP
jgi:hypothetical protein